VIRPVFSVLSAKRSNEVKLKLQELKERHVGSMAKGSLLHAQMLNGRLENALTEYALIHNIDLIITGSYKNISPVFGFNLNIDRLSARTGCPVLNLHSGSLDTIKNILLPVSSTLPLKKIMLATYLAKTFNAAIHLISLNRYNPAAEPKTHIYLEKTYQLLRQNTNLSLNCSMVLGENIADTTLEYARRVEADLILVNPGKESLLSGSANKWFSNFFPMRSGIPVITVA
jgi:hypothetical protein